MPRLTRVAPIGIPQHVIQRGNNHQACFGSDEDMKANKPGQSQYN
jgi:putative transposase